MKREKWKISGEEEDWEDEMRRIAERKYTEMEVKRRSGEQVAIG